MHAVSRSCARLVGVDKASLTLPVEQLLGTALMSVADI